MKQEDIKRLWEWCGFKYRRSNPHHFQDNVEAQKRDMAWYHPKDNYGSHSIPNIDLDNLFKYAVPKIRKMQGVWLYDILSRWIEIAVSHPEDNPAEALGSAILKVIDNE